jgi:hypothetical protein
LAFAADNGAERVALSWLGVRLLHRRWLGSLSNDHTNALGSSDAEGNLCQGSDETHVIFLERFTRFEAGDGIWRQGRTLISSIVSHANRASGQLPGRARYLRYTQVLCTALERALILQLGALLAAGPGKSAVQQVRQLSRLQETCAANVKAMPVFRPNWDIGFWRLHANC